MFVLRTTMVFKCKQKPLVFIWNINSVSMFNYGTQTLIMKLMIE